MANETRKPEIVLFWSFKGGQGRSWSCANMALDLALNHGKRVLMLDFDYRASGLHHFFQSLGMPHPYVGSSALPFGFVDGLLRYYTAHQNSVNPAKGNRSSSQELATTSLRDEFAGFLRRYKVPTSPEERFPAQSILQKWAGDEGAQAPNVDQSRLEEGGLVDVTIPIDLDAAARLLQDPLQANLGALFIAPAGDVFNDKNRRFLGEGYPWRVLTDPRSNSAETAALPFSDAFYISARLLADSCGAEYVFVDLPAGVGTVAEQLIAPEIGGGQPQTLMFQHGQPCGLIAVTTLSYQALEGTAALMQGKLTGPRVYPDEGTVPAVIQRRGALVLYNMVGPGLVEPDKWQDIVEEHSRLCKIPATLSKPTWELGEQLPTGVIPRFPHLYSGEWLAPLDGLRHIHFGPYKLEVTGDQARWDNDARRVRTSLRRWTSHDRPSPGRLCVLRNKGAFWSEPEFAPVCELSEIRLAGEDVPVLRAYLEQLLTTVESQLPDLTTLSLVRFDHPELFECLSLCPESKAIVSEFADKCGLESAGYSPSFPTRTFHAQRGDNFSALSQKWDDKKSWKKEKTTLGKLWKQCDVVAIPQYMLGYAVSNLGISSLDELLSEEHRDYLEHQVRGFRTLCCYRGVWVGLPLSVLGKLLISRERLNGSRRQFSDIRRQVLGDAPLVDDKWILTEGEANTVSMWYEWEQVLRLVGAELFHRDQPEDFPGYLDPEDTQLRDSIFAGIKSYWQLIQGQDESDVGRVDWTVARDRFLEDNDYKLWLGWSDWADSVQQAMAKKGEEAFYYPLPLARSGGGSQPLESWTLVFPRKDNQTRARKTAEAMYLTMHEEWQRRYQVVGGASAFEKVLQDHTLSAQQPWLSSVRSLLRTPTTKGNSAMVPEYARAMMAFLTCVLYDSSDDIQLPTSEKELWKRFENLWGSFVSTLNKLRNIEVMR